MSSNSDNNNEKKAANKARKRGGGSWIKYVIISPLLLALSLVYLPGFWVRVLLYVDYFTPWVLFESPMYDMYHNFLVSRLPEREELPVPEISIADATREEIFRVSKGYTFPIIIRGLLKDSPALNQWNSRDWWVKNYGSEEVLCGTLSNVREQCTIKDFWDDLDAGVPFYISGASEIVDRHPELHDMIDNPIIRHMEPGNRTATQIFMGFPQMGSDIHCAIGINIFRQIVGQKKWWFIPPSQTPYLKPSINVRGISAHTHTMVGKQGGKQSPWLSKLERYVTVLNPGDVLINPPWFWHGILNLGDSSKNDLVIGSPTRYTGPDCNVAAFKSNPQFSITAFGTILYRYGAKALKPGFKINLQQDIANNRRSREKKELVEVDPFDEDIDSQKGKK